MKSYVVIGLGRFGASLARQLCKLGAEVLALDVKGDLVQQVASEVTHAVVGDAQDKEVLRALGVRNMDCAIIAIGDNLAASVLITMNLKELGIPFTDPEGTYFVLADIAPYMKKGQSDVEFCVEMAQKVGVACVPGSSFFDEDVNHIVRLHFAKKDETLLSALDRLSRLKQIMCG